MISFKHSKNIDLSGLLGLKHKWIKYIFLLSVLFFSCSKNKRNLPENTLFQKLTAETTNVNFENTVTPTQTMNILDYLYFYNGGGVAVGDINNDDRVDVFFTSNQGKNKLYLNKGSFQFEDITQQAGVAGNSDWNTGTVMADVNGDGWLDIYVCAVSKIQDLRGKNELYINNGNNTFSEQASTYGLDFQNYTTSATFFDYDNDGDLDLYLLNHAIHTQNSFGKASIRNNRTLESGDKLLRNDGDKFTDVSPEAGIFGGANGYGLGVATTDFNQDGYTDIYVSNDFHEDDYYYLNRGDGTFEEKLKDNFGHVSRFSMGSDVSDINHDGYVDILTLDMIADNEKILKTSTGDETLDMLEMRIRNLGYHYQFSRNMLQINQKGKFFSETALLSKVAATDWSWSALFADYDLDGEQDIFISNGIPKRPNDLDYIKYISDQKIKDKLTKTKLIDQQALDLMPSGAVNNQIFQGKKGIGFEKSNNWIPKENTISNGSAYADFDNDGDLDIVTNNSNAAATFYKNTTNKNYLKLKFRYKEKNNLGIGTKVYSYHKGVLQYQQLFTSKGFQSSSEAAVYFGYGNTTKVDSIKIVWPDQTVQVAENIKTNQTLTIQLLNKRSAIDYTMLYPKSQPWFKKVDSLPGLQLTHKENNFNDFNRQKLIPYKISERGPAIAVGDLNGDQLDDIFFGSSRGKTSKMYVQTKGGFELLDTTITQNRVQEDIVAAIQDFDKNGKNDLFVGAAGGEFYGTSKNLLDRIYYNEGNGNFKKIELSNYFEQTSTVAPYDIDQDGDLDMFVGSHAVANDFGKVSNSYLLINNQGNFSIKENKELQKIGMVTNAIWSDFDNDGVKDLIVVGEWMSPRFLKNTKGQLKDITQVVLEQNRKGLWQSIQEYDIDSDGDLDYLLGNFGENTKLKASKEEPLRMYYSDFDENGKTETIVAISKEGKYYPLLGLDELASQLNFLKKKFTSYKDFAGKSMDEIFDKKMLNKAKIFEVQDLASGYMDNDKGKFSFKPFDEPLQVAPIRSMLKHDFDKDGQEEVLLAGNYFGTVPYHGRYDSFGGAILDQKGTIVNAADLGVKFVQKAVVGLNIINFAERNYLLVTINNKEAEIYEVYQ